MNARPSPACLSARWRRCAPAIAGLLLAVSAGADVRRDFEWRRPIEEPGAAGALYRIPIPGEVKARCNQFPYDLRIVDAEGSQWPFFLQPQPPEERWTPLAATRMNETQRSEEGEYLRVDLHLAAAANGSRPRHQRVRVSTTGQDFIRRVEVYGSDDQNRWGLLSQGYLLHSVRPQLLVQDVVEYPLSDLPFLQVRIYPNARRAQEEFTLGSVQVQRREQAGRIHADIALAALEPAAGDQVKGAQVLVADTGFEQHPIQRILVGADGGDYVRAVEVSVRDRTEELWRRVGMGSIQRISGYAADSIAVNARGRYIRCAIYHHDDPPLDQPTLRAESLQEFLVVEARGGPAPILYYGGAFADAPRYDLASRSKAVDLAGLPGLRLGAETENPAFRQAGFGSLGPWLAGLAIGAVSLLVIWVIVGMLPKKETP